VYRHFPSKAALREAVTRRWLGRALPRLALIADGAEPAAERLQAWLAAVFAAKREAVAEDPELFATYGLLAAEHSGAAADHVADLLRQLVRIISEFDVEDPETTARAVFEATTAFHHPAHATEWSRADTEMRFTEVCELILTALRRP
jgi:AcrR family transcriptional regulator